MTEQCKLCGAWVHDPCRSESQMATCEWGVSSTRSEEAKMAHHAAAFGDAEEGPTAGAWDLVVTDREGDVLQRVGGLQTAEEARQVWQQVLRPKLGGLAARITVEREDALAERGGPWKWAAMKTLQAAPPAIPEDTGAAWWPAQRCWLVRSERMASLVNLEARINRPEPIPIAEESEIWKALDTEAAESVRLEEDEGIRHALRGQVVVFSRALNRWLVTDELQMDHCKARSKLTGIEGRADRANSTEQGQFSYNLDVWMVPQGLYDELMQREIKPETAAEILRSEAGESVANHTWWCEALDAWVVSDEVRTVAVEDAERARQLSSYRQALRIEAHKALSEPSWSSDLNVWMVSHDKMERLQTAENQLKRARVLLGYSGGLPQLYEEIMGHPVPEHIVPHRRVINELEGKVSLLEGERFALRDELSDAKRQITDLGDERDAWRNKAEEAEKRIAALAALTGLAELAKDKEADRWCSTLGVWLVPEGRHVRFEEALDSVGELERARREREELKVEVATLNSKFLTCRGSQRKLVEKMGSWMRARNGARQSESGLHYSEELGLWVATKEGGHGLMVLKNRLGLVQEDVNRARVSGQAVWSSELGVYVVTGSSGARPVGV